MSKSLKSGVRGSTFRLENSIHVCHDGNRKYGSSLDYFHVEVVGRQWRVEKQFESCSLLARSESVEVLRDRVNEFSCTSLLDRQPDIGSVRQSDPQFEMSGLRSGRNLIPLSISNQICWIDLVDIKISTKFKAQSTGIH